MNTVTATIRHSWKIYPEFVTLTCDEPISDEEILAVLADEEQLFRAPKNANHSIVITDIVRS